MPTRDEIDEQVIAMAAEQKLPEGEDAQTNTDKAEESAESVEKETEKSVTTDKASEAPSEEPQSKEIDWSAISSEEEKPADQSQVAKALSDVATKFQNESFEERAQKLANLYNSGRQKEIEAIASSEGLGAQDLLDKYVQIGDDAPTPQSNESELLKRIQELENKVQPSIQTRERDLLIEKFASANGLDPELIKNNDQFKKNWNDPTISKLSTDERLKLAIRLTPEVLDAEVAVKANEKARKLAMAAGGGVPQSGDAVSEVITDPTKATSLEEFNKALIGTEKA